MIPNLQLRLGIAKNNHLVKGGKMAGLLEKMAISSDLWRRMYSHGTQPSHSRTIKSILKHFKKEAI